MELSAAISTRRMTRHFRDQSVDATLLDALLATARYAPTAGFTQGVELLALTTSDARATFWEYASSATWRAGAEAEELMVAPVIVVPLGDPGAYESRYARPDKQSALLGALPAPEWPVPYWLVDASFAAMLLLLAANDAGLGALFFQLHGDSETLLEALGVPKQRATIGALAIGYPAADQPLGTPSRPPRRSRGDLVHFERFGDAP